MKELKEKIKSKIDRLLEEGALITYLESQPFQKQGLRIDRITISQHSVSSMKSGHEITEWVRSVELDFEMNPILMGDGAEEVYKHLLGKNESIKELYLNN